MIAKTAEHAATMKSAADEARARRYKDIFWVTVYGSVIDLSLGIAKIVFGFIAHSQALIADGVHSLSDLVTDFFVIYAAKHSHKEADEEHPYGHGRIETVATVALGIALIMIGLGISYDAASRLFHPEQLLMPGMWAIVIATISILSKEAIYHYTLHYAKKYRSSMLKANAWHSRSDAISSIIVVIGVAGSMAGLNYLDAIAAIGVAFMIAKIGWDQMLLSVRELIDTGLEPEKLEQIRSIIHGVDGVQRLHILRTRRMGGEALVDVHIQVDPEVSVSEGHQISETVRQRVISEVDEVCDVLVHIDPEDDEQYAPNAGLPLRGELIDRLKLAWADIDGTQYIDEVTLHYLHGKVTVDLLLPLFVVQNKPEEEERLREKFDRVAEQLEDVDSIRLHYH